MSEIINITGPSPLAIVNNAIQRGSAAPFLNSFSGKYSPTSGWSFNQKFSGLSYWQMQNLAYLYANSGCSYTINYENGKATLETEDNRGNVTIDTWEIGVNRTTRGELQNPRYFPGGAIALDPDAFKVIADFVRGDINYQTADLRVAGFVSGGSLSPEFRLLDRIHQGQDSYQFDQYTLRHTTNASNRGYFNVADANVNSIYSYSNFINEITNSSYWIFPCPPELLGALSDIFYWLQSPPSYFMKGALKGGSQRATTANNRVNIYTEYALDVWGTDGYRTF